MPTTLPIIGETITFGAGATVPSGEHVHVQLIHPPQRISPTNLVSAVAIAPLGLAYLASSLEASGHTVSVIDGVGDGLDNVYQLDGRTLRGLTGQQIVDRIDPAANVIGMGIMFSCTWPSLRGILASIKERYPEKVLVLGGEHPTALPEFVFEQSPVDVVVLGEGEETLVELCGRIARKKSFADLPGIAFRDGMQIKINPRRTRIRDVDAIPRPAWHHFDIPKYIDYRQPHGSADGRSMPMLGTRGCPFQCTFCGSPGMWGTTWRARKASEIVDEMQLYMERYGANDFHFEDLTAVVRKDMILELANEILRRNLGISWQLPSGTRSEAIDGEVAVAMYASGCRQFTYALESGSPEILKSIKKQIKLDRAFASAKAAISAGIRVQCCFIYGFPQETWRNFWQTYKTILRCALAGFQEVTVCAFQPLPNTELFREVEKDHPIELTDDYFDTVFGYLGIWGQRSWNKRLPNVLIRLLILFSFASFFSLSFLVRPRRFFHLIKGIFSSNSQGKFARVLKGMLISARASRSAKLQNSTAA